MICRNDEERALMEHVVTPVGTVTGGRREPANSDNWGAVTATILIDERFGDDCLAGLSDFSHVEVVFMFHRAVERDGYRGLRAPRGRADLPAVGVFCDRGPRRPNRIGVTACRILSADGRRLRVRGLDAVDGTPVLDLKPVMRELLPAQVRQPEWVGVLMQDYLRD
jgi:tRNA-Thr(GGU) m(6)t(6)A37 methyltransferase TsaA